MLLLRLHETIFGSFLSSFAHKVFVLMSIKPLAVCASSSCTVGKHTLANIVYVLCSDVEMTLNEVGFAPSYGAHNIAIR